MRYTSDKVSYTHPIHATFAMNEQGDWVEVISYNKSGREPCGIPETEQTCSPFSPPAAPVEGASRPAVDPYDRLEVRITWAQRITVLAFMASCLAAAIVLLWSSTNG